MKLVFISNYLSAHQAPICNTFHKILGHDFSFVSLGKIGKERIKLGMSKISYDYNIELEENEKIPEGIIRLIYDADVVICGNCPDALIRRRLRTGKLTFKYVERLYKNETDFLRKVRTVIGTYIHYIRYRKHQFYVLCASAYTAGDINRIFRFDDRCFRWGYFPKYIKYDDIDTLISSKDENSILWVGRFLDWKHPEIPVLLAEKLKNGGYEFSMSIAGTGDMQAEVEQLIEEKRLGNCVHMLGPVKNEQVRKLMEKSQIHLFTSDFYEGWGAVLNEAMNSGCVCFASHAIGSVPYLISDNENGIIFKNGDIDDLYNKVSKIIQDNELKKRIALNAYKSIEENWNEEVAAVRLIELSKRLLYGDTTPFSENICSISPSYSNHWYK